MSKITCDVIRDLLPLYADDVLSKDSIALVEEHLGSCKSCQKELEEMKKPVVLPDFQKAQIQDAEVIKGMRRKLNRKRIGIVVMSVLITIVVVLGGVYFLALRGFSAPIDHFEITPMTTQNEDGSLSWHVSVLNINEKPIGTSTKIHYQKDLEGKRIESGLDIYFYEPVIGDPGQWNPPQYAVGYVTPELDTLPTDFDYIVNLIFKDKTITYSMREEGIFCP